MQGIGGGRSYYFGGIGGRHATPCHYGYASLRQFFQAADFGSAGEGVRFEAGGQERVATGLYYLPEGSFGVAAKVEGAVESDVGVTCGAAHGLEGVQVDVTLRREGAYDYTVGTEADGLLYVAAHHLDLLRRVKEISPARAYEHVYGNRAFKSGAELAIGGGQPPFRKRGTEFDAVGATFCRRADAVDVAGADFKQRFHFSSSSITWSMSSGTVPRWSVTPSLEREYLTGVRSAKRTAFLTFSGAGSRMSGFWAPVTWT